MKAIFRIEEYLEDTQQIIVKFCKLYDTKLIDQYPPIAMDIKNLDTYDYDFFVKSLMRQGTYIIEEQEKLGLLINDIETIDRNEKLDISSLVGRNIECNMENYKLSLIKMRRVEL
jgi:hypothetical protein